MKTPAMDECYALMRLRLMHNRKPRYFYVAPDVWDALWIEISHYSKGGLPLAAPSGCVLLYGLEIGIFDFPPGFILVSETRLQ